MHSRIYTKNTPWPKQEGVATQQQHDRKDDGILSPVAARRYRRSTGIAKSGSRSWNFSASWSHGNDVKFSPDSPHRLVSPTRPVAFPRLPPIPTRPDLCHNGLRELQVAGTPSRACRRPRITGTSSRRGPPETDSCDSWYQQRQQQQQDSWKGWCADPQS